MLQWVKVGLVLFGEEINVSSRKLFIYLFIAYLSALSKGQFMWCRLERLLIKNYFQFMRKVTVVA
jgi:hypothetical protein